MDETVEIMGMTCAVIFVSDARMAGAGDHVTVDVELPPDAPGKTYRVVIIEERT